MKKTRLLTTLTALLSFSLAPLHSLYAQDQIVIDDLSRGELRAEIEKVENAFYSVFNEAVEDPKLRIQCSMYTPTGSHIPRRACEPQFMIDARNQNIQDWQNNVDDLASVEELRASLSTEFEQLTAAMNQVLAGNSYFRELNTVLRMLRERLQELDE